ncbi:MAG: T9SS type A sorting domain-containing protein [Bacteroidota bacterium]
MKNSLFLLLMLSVLTTTTTLAQRHRPHPPRQLELTEELKAELALTPEQITAVENLQAEAKAAADDLRQQEGGEPEARREAMRNILRNVKDGMAEILSDEQLAQLRNVRDARRQEQRELMKSVDREALRAEMREYRELNVKPVMENQRAKLNESLSDADKASLVAYRIVLAEAKAAARAEHQTEREKRKAERAERDEPQARRQHRGHKHGQARQKLHEKYPEIFTDLEAMVERYDTEITRLLDEVSDEREQWKADQKAITERYMPQELIEQHEERRAKHEPNPERQARREQGRKIHFLLQESLTEAEVEMAEEMVEIAAAAYPNPATNATTLSFDLPNADVIRIDLRDEQGGLVKNITRDSFVAGKNQVAIDLGDLTNGTYYLTLNSRAFKAPQSVKILVVK